MAEVKEVKQKGYVKSTIDGKTYYLGYFEDVESELQRLEDTGEISALFDSSKVNFDIYPSEHRNPSLNVVSEKEFLDIAARKAPYEF